MARHQTHAALFLGSLICLAPLATAQRGGQDPTQRPSSRPSVNRASQKAAREFRHLELDGKQVAEQVDKLTGRLHWYSSLASAMQTARGQNKPLLWIHALGDIDGFL